VLGIILPIILPFMIALPDISILLNLPSRVLPDASAILIPPPTSFCISAPSKSMVLPDR